MWMCHPTAPIPVDLRLWEDVAGCFEAAAMAVALLRQVIENGEEYRRFLEKALDLTAEAQSALRMAVEMVDGKPDTDQYRMFNWLRQAATEEQIFIARFMRLDDPADPTRWNDLQERIGQLDSEIEEIRQRDKQRVKLLKKGQYHARIIGDGKGTEADWKKVIEAVDTLVGEGTPASNTDLRDMLVPIVDEIPDANGLSRRFPASPGRGGSVPGDTEPAGAADRAGGFRRGAEGGRPLQGQDDDSLSAVTAVRMPTRR